MKDDTIDLKFLPLFQTCEFFSSDLKKKIQEQTIMSIKFKGHYWEPNGIIDVEKAFLLTDVIKI